MLAVIQSNFILISFYYNIDNSNSEEDPEWTTVEKQVSLLICPPESNDKCILQLPYQPQYHAQGFLGGIKKTIPVGI